MILNHPHFNWLHYILFYWPLPKGRRAARTYFNMVRTDPIEMDLYPPLTPLPPTNLPSYIVYHSNFNATEKSRT